MTVTSTALAASEQSPAAAKDPAAVLRAIGAARLDPARAVSLTRVRLNVGPATLDLTGTLVPAVADGLDPVELVFLGKGRIEMDAPDAIEAGQLELFTGAPRLAEHFTQAVLVLGPDAAVSALLRKPRLELDTAASEAAEGLWNEWRRKRERELFSVDRGILLDALADPLASGYFGAWLIPRASGGPAARSTTSELAGGERSFLYFVQADEQEQVTLGRFVPLDATEKEKRQIAKELRRQQKKGRARGLEVDDLGQWDTWVSTTLRDGTGRPVAGTPAFEPTKYTLDVRLTEPGLRLAGTARIELERVVRGSRAVALSLPRDFEVARVRDGAGSELFFHRGEHDLTVILPASAGDSAATTVVVEYAGNPIEKDWNLSALLGTENWYPRAGLVDRARYEATFHWPRELELVASGKQVDHGVEADGTRWQRRVLEVPAMGFSFEIGRFDLQTANAGHVEVTFAFGPAAFTQRQAREQLMRTVTDALDFYEETFGPYPLDYLTVSTIPRGFSQGLLGFVTVSDLLSLWDFGIWNRYFDVEDWRVVVAHELAHQWWGNAVGWTSYRDQWISEAMAEHAASLYAKQRIDKLKGIGYRTTWQEDLGERLASGRPIETVGPVVLGQRLSSSLADDAYRVIVYEKGAVVLEMLANLLGEENLTKALASVVKAAAGKNVSTAELLAMIGSATGTDLDGFARQFVYGTGLPRVLYSYRWQKQGDGWLVAGEAKQLTPSYFRYRVVPTDRGTFDVARQAVPSLDVRESGLVVPTEIAVRDPSHPKGKGPGGANGSVQGRLFMKGEGAKLEVPLDFEPQAFWLDRHGTVFGHFVDESKHPKRAAYYRAQDAIAGGRLEEADRLLGQALAAEHSTPEAEDGQTLYWQQIQEARRALDARIESDRAFVFMDLGRDEEAEAALGRARRALRDDLLLDRMQARLEVRLGRYDKAYRLLRRSDRHDALDAQDYALLAIAARQTGHADEADEALAKAKANGVDTSALLQQ